MSPTTTLIVGLLQIFYVIFVVLFLISEDREPEDTLLWMIILITFPVVGFIIFLLFGRDWRKGISSIRKQKEISDKASSRYLKGFYKNFTHFHNDFVRKNKDNWLSRVATLTLNNNESPVLPARSYKILPSGELGFASLLKDLKNANKFIHMQFFIWEYDELTAEITKILKDRIDNGVEVRIMYDFLGSIAYRKKELRELKRYGATVVPDVTNITMLNYRNHRKIAVIDGDIGYTGGINIGQEYIDGGKHYPSWRDTFVKIEGQFVSELENLFAVKWLARKGENLWNKKYMPVLENPGEIPMQLSFSATYYPWQATKQAYIQAILNAKEKVYIQSPYFIPDRSLADALETASLAGVDVRLMMTGWPDKKSAWWAARTFFEKMLKAGMKIYYYDAGFFHAKEIVVDDDFVSIGSTNFDMRSFTLNNEDTAFIYDKAAAKEMHKIFENDLKECSEFTLKDYEKLTSFEKFRNSISKLFSNLF